MADVHKKAKVGRKKLDKKKEDIILGIRLDKEVKEFYLAHRGLAKKVLMDFYNRVEEIKRDQRKQDNTKSNTIE